MTNVIKISLLFSIFIFAAVAFSAAPNVSAFGDSGGSGSGSGGDSGCCDYSQSGYYGQSGYYSQGSYSSYGQGSYYSQGSYVQPVAKCDYLTANKTSVPAAGGDVTLSWGTTNASSVSISGVGTVSADGTKTVNVTANTTFTLTAVGAGGNDSCVVQVTLQPASAAKCDFLTTNKQTLPFGGGDVILTWKTTNASSASISPSVGTVTPTAGGSITVPVSSDTTFTLTAVGAGGNDSCVVSIDVQDDQSFKCDYLTASKTLVNKGETFTLSWGTTNADSVSINQGIGSVSDDGDLTTSTQVDRTYILTATKGNETDTCPVSVQVKEDNYSQGSYGGGGSSSKTPKCTLKISDKKIKKGEKVTLKWTTTNATDVVIKDNHGKTIIDTDDLSSKDKKDFLDGEITLRPVRDTEYTLNAERGSKDKECEVEVEVENEVVVLETRDQQPLVAGIALTQVPYTGFEAGPVLTFIFYTLLALWAFFVAYVLVVKKKVS